MIWTVFLLINGRWQEKSSQNYHHRKGGAKHPGSLVKPETQNNLEL